MPSALCVMDMGINVSYDATGISFPVDIEFLVTFPSSEVHKYPSLSMNKRYAGLGSDDLSVVWAPDTFSTVLDLMSYLKNPLSQVETHRLFCLSATTDFTDFPANADLRVLSSLNLSL